MDMAHHDPIEMEELGPLAEYNAQNMQHCSSQYGSPTAFMSPHTYPDPSHTNSNLYNGTPSTESSSPYMATTRVTRSGRPITSRLGRRSAGVQKLVTAKARPKPRRRNQEKTTLPTVDQPLSVLLAHMDPKKDADINMYVHRSVAVRLREVETCKDGKVKRPMNAFMLYRKGWQNRIKEMQSNENHQGVSRVAGDSWALEPEEVRNQYNHWSEVERDMHAQAFPDYKFRPQKPEKKPRKSGNLSDGDDTDLDDDWSGVSARVKRIHVTGDDLNGEYRPPGRMSSHVYPHKHPVPPSRATSHSPYQHSPYQQYHTLAPTQNMSHYQYSNPHTPMPDPYPAGGHDHYREQRVDAQHNQMHHSYGGYTVRDHGYQTENVYYSQTPAPARHYMSPSPQPGFTDQDYGIPQPQFYTQHQMHAPYSVQVSQPRHHTPTSRHCQPSYGSPAVEDHKQYVPLPVTPGNDGADHFAAAMKDMGGLDEQFPLNMLEGDPGLDLDFQIGDGTDMLDPALMDPNSWITGALPLDTQGKPNDFLSRTMNEPVTAMGAPELTCTPAGTSAAFPTPLRTPTPRSTTASAAAPEHVSVMTSMAAPPSDTGAA